jgi:MFS family permease
VSVVLGLHLRAIGLEAGAIGLLLSLALAGDTVLSLALATRADRLGRRRVLAAGALLMSAAGLTFAAATDFTSLALAATLGIVSPSGGEVGPFLAVEQAALSQAVGDEGRTRAFAWYHVTGALAAALGALAAGLASEALQARGLAPAESHAPVFVAYAAAGGMLVGLFSRLSVRAEPPPAERSHARRDGLGLTRSRGLVLRLSALFALDSFAGALALQSVLAWWLAERFGASPAALGGLFFASNALSAASAIVAVPLARRIGLVNTMVFTHIPANLLLVALPFAPGLGQATALLLARACLSQMDVPTRQSYVMAVVAAEERSAAAGVTGVARTLGGAAAPLVAGTLLQRSLAGTPFLAAGLLKIAYDLMLLAAFRRVRPPEEAARVSPPPPVT